MDLLLPSLGVWGYRRPFAFCVHNVNIRRLDYFGGTVGQTGSRTSQSSWQKKIKLRRRLGQTCQENVCRMSILLTFPEKQNEIFSLVQLETKTHTRRSLTQIHTRVVSVRGKCHARRHTLSNSWPRRVTHTHIETSTGELSGNVHEESNSTLDIFLSFSV